MSIAQLAEIFRQLRVAGCHNWNLVSPTPWLPMITEALDLACRTGTRLPVVYNTSGYERMETLRALKGIVDVYLADLRYAERETARSGSEAPDYVKHARAGLLEMWQQLGPLRMDNNGVAWRGVICRLLIMPGLANEVCESLRWLADNIGTKIAISVMAQYTPANRATTLMPWNRAINRAEYDLVQQTMEQTGFNGGWIQDYSVVGDTNLAGFNMQPT